MGEIELYDATLRDGMGGGGLDLTVREKLQVVHRLDALGIDIVEAGFPASNPKESELFALLATEQLDHAEVAAFGMTRRRDASADADPGLAEIAGCFAPICTIVGKSSPLHVEVVVRVSPEENLAMIAESVAFLVGEGKRVILDAEHFFDGYAEDPSFALECVRAAAEAGAERVVLCDTNGGSLPMQVQAVLGTVRESLPDLALGIHTHDDSGCAVANSLVAVHAGATQVQGTMNGIGERTGNANLVTLIADLQLKMGFQLLDPERLASLTQTAHFMDEVLNRTPGAAQPYVGKNAFAHKAGLHAAGVRTDARTFEHVDPALVGNDRDLLVSELSGRATIMEKAQEAGVELDELSAQRTAQRVKELEHRGYQFEAADGSFELLMRRQSGHYERLFELESWRVIVEKRAQGGVATEATIKLWVPDRKTGMRIVRTAEGNGPVNALDKALREAIGEIHPHLRDIELVNFKVRILDEEKGTGAVTRVLLDSSDGDLSWGAIGVSENVIEASWEALVDAIEYGMQPGRQHSERPPALKGSSEPAT
ncbi:MAG TPA: citramalate synthase [Solirubrobacteraceae bacterium]|jgi:2-isopropylmalate synthase|nr:citramalate synthase [Solirubrobacteraceae bacterium]